MPYRLIKTEHAARRGEFETVHGTVQTPAFMNVATAAAIKDLRLAYPELMIVGIEPAVKLAGDSTYSMDVAKKEVENLLSVLR